MGTSRRFVALGALVAGIAACAPETQSAPVIGDTEDFGQVAAGWGVAITGCSQGTTGFGVDVSGQLTIPMTAEPIILSAPGGVLKMNGQVCTTGDGGAGTALLVTGTTGTNLVKKIVIASSGVVMLDLYDSGFTNVFAGGVDRGLEVTFFSLNGAFLVRGSTFGDQITVVQQQGTDLYFDIGRGAAPDGKADAKVSFASAVKLSLGGGNDVFTPVLTGAFTYDGAALDPASLELPALSMKVYGGDGNDVITDGDGDDTIYGGAGDDVIKATNSGEDDLYGGSATTVDLLDYSARSTAISGVLNGAFSIDGATHHTFEFENLNGGWGNDVLAGDSGNNLIYGGNGHDAIDAKAGADTIWGGAGNDTITGGSGVATIDYLYGGDGDDKFVADSSVDGVDIISGGNGLDTVDYSLRTTGVSAISNDIADDNLTLTEHLLGSGYDDVLIGSSANDRIEGGAGNDSLVGGLGNDTLSGGLGNDTIDGAAGNDQLAGDEGADSIVGGAGNDTIRGNDGNDTLWGGLGSDVLYGNAGVNTMDGGSNPLDLCFSEVEGTDSIAANSCDIFFGF